MPVDNFVHSYGITPACYPQHEDYLEDNAVSHSDIYVLSWDSLFPHLLKAVHFKLWFRVEAFRHLWIERDDFAVLSHEFPKLSTKKRCHTIEGMTPPLQKAVV